ncbi:DDE-type integrase/transposase/recombinase [Gracilibacillus lacisalsi]|uniref:DDE-type integrase/transposase/recombinase n=1 Tax=Gracilibacillus lacisalsi TaxID=393087 RepID=UPI00035DC190|nr:DDE-type integrase/transposase/recombinase [Gracilibacillus lacisalsi]
MLVVNDVIQNVHTEETFRILWLDRQLKLGYIIDTQVEKALPIKLKLNEVEDDLANGDSIYIEDNLLSNRLVKYDIKEQDVQFRNRAWESIKDIVHKEPDIYLRQRRGKLIREVVAQKNVSANTIMKYLRKYWQRGMVVDSLLPDYVNCGNYGDYQFKRKAGRPRKKGGGINVSEELKEIFKICINKYYLSRTKPSLQFAYDMMIKDYFKKGYVYTENKRKLVLQDEENIPSYYQFYYWFQKLYQLDVVVKKREGETAFERNYRKLLGSTEHDALGPGSLYQIDATPADIFLLNRFNTNWMVGKPTLYFVIDVFSRMITGFYISLNNPSWISMATALQNAFSDKGEYCNRLGISFAEGDWPVIGLPNAIIGDRGELESKFADSLVEGLGIEIHNNPPYRPDWKGIVEQLFHSSHDLLRPLLPGYIHKDSGKRGSIDFRHKATLTLDDYVKVIVYFILYYNHNHYMSDYNRNVDMIEDNVRPIPIELWNWGIKINGGLQKANKNLVDFHLLPTDMATVTAQGIRYKIMLYSCDIAIEEDWFVKARKKKWKMKFSYDPRNMDVIYLHVKGTESPYKMCTLLPHQEKFLNKSLNEIDQLMDHEAETKDSLKHNKLTNKLNLYTQVEEIVKEAETRKKAEHDSNISKSNKISQLKTKRSKEQNERYLDEKIELKNTSKHVEFPKNELDPINKNSIHNQSYSIMDLFSKQRMKKNEE